ncbi:MAG: DUF3306 domain-containing protein [Hyphomicrobium aestuarii]|nr:DUF3306 domain-containing protein [Hyphomicrobium aestuarii]
MTPVSDDGDGSDAAETGSTFIERWSRRKRQQTGAPGLDRPTTPEIADQDVSADSIGRGEAADGIAEPELPLPSLDDLTVEGDVKAFLEKRVPEELRRLAMRKMWSLDPQIRDFVEMAENQYDWNTPGGVPGYGDLNPGTDLEALLAQAIGSGPTAPAAEADDTENGADDAMAEGVAIADAPPDSVRLSEAPSARPEALSTSSQICDDSAEIESSAAIEADAQHAWQSVRRHGGALPA